MFQLYDEPKTYDRVVLMDCDVCGEKYIVRTPVEHLTSIYFPGLAFYVEWAMELDWVIAAVNQVWCPRCWKEQKERHENPHRLCVK